MSKFTTELRYICEQKAGVEESVGYDDVGQVLHACHNIVMPNYPIFDEAYREVLNTKILKHYYTREICEETYGLWKLRMDVRMNEIMPYYNQLYADKAAGLNPLFDVDLKTEHTKDNNGASESESKNRVVDERSDERNGTSVRKSDTVSKSESNNVGSTNSESEVERGQLRQYSDTPQGGLGNIAGTTAYLTNLTKDDGTEGTKNKGSTVTSGSSEVKYGEDGSVSDSIVSSGNGKREGKRSDSSVIASTEEYVERVYGRRGGTAYAKALLEFKNSILNIDKMIIEELKDLFFGLYA